MTSPYDGCLGVTGAGLSRFKFLAALLVGQLTTEVVQRRIYGNT